jgi:hypothetical protein
MHTASGRSSWSVCCLVASIAYMLTVQSVHNTRENGMASIVKLAADTVKRSKQEVNKKEPAQGFVIRYSI